MKWKASIEKDDKTSGKEDKKKGTAKFSATAWADPTFLAFIKEYWEYNHGAKHRDVAMTFIAHVKPDGQTVKDRIVAYFDVQDGTCKPYLVMNKLPHYLINSFEMAGTPADWRRAVDKEDMTILKEGIAHVVKTDPLLQVKASLGKSFPSIVKRVWERICNGDKPGIPIEPNVVYGDDDLYAARRPIGMTANGVDLVPAIKMAMRKRYLAPLEQTTPQNLSEYWTLVHKMPNLDDHRGTEPMKMPVELVADPFLKRDMLAYKNMAIDESQKIEMLRNLLNERLGGPPESTQPEGSTQPEDTRLPAKIPGTPEWKEAILGVITMMAKDPAYHDKKMEEITESDMFRDACAIKDHPNAHAVYDIDSGKGILIKWDTVKGFTFKQFLALSSVGRPVLYCVYT